MDKKKLIVRIVCGILGVLMVVGSITLIAQGFISGCSAA